MQLECDGMYDFINPSEKELEMIDLIIQEEIRERERQQREYEESNRLYLEIPPPPPPRPKEEVREPKRVIEIQL